MLGCRSWLMSDVYGLGSITREHKWLANSNWAKCLPTDPLIFWDGDTIHLCKESPSQDCKQEYGCGLYADRSYVKTLRRATESMREIPRCLGAVYAWGTLIEHEDGVIRSEIMDIWQLFGVPFLYPRATHYEGLIKSIAIQFNVPFVMAGSKEELFNLWEQFLSEYPDLV